MSKVLPEEVDENLVNSCQRIFATLLETEFRPGAWAKFRLHEDGIITDDNVTSPEAKLSTLLVEVTISHNHELEYKKKNQTKNLRLLQVFSRLKVLFVHYLIDYSVNIASENTRLLLQDPIIGGSIWSSACVVVFLDSLGGTYCFSCF